MIKEFRSNYRRCKQCNIIYTQQDDDICLMCKKVCHICKFTNANSKISYNALQCVNKERTIFRCAICGNGFDIESKEFLKSTRKRK